MHGILLQFQSTAAAPSLDEARRQFGLAEGDVDPVFGVVLVDRKSGLYAIRIEERCRGEIEERHRRRGRGELHQVRFFPDPRIDPLGGDEG